MEWDMKGTEQLMTTDLAYTNSNETLGTVEGVGAVGAVEVRDIGMLYTVPTMDYLSNSTKTTCKSLRQHDLKI